MLKGALSGAARSPGRYDFAREMLSLQSAVAAAHGDIETVMAAVVDAALKIVPSADGAMVVTLDDEDSSIARAVAGLLIHLKGQRLQVGIGRFAIDHGEPFICQDSETIEQIDRERCRALDVRSFVSMPVPHAGGYIGLLTVHAAIPHAFDEADILAIQMLVGPLAIGFAGQAQDDAYHAYGVADRRFAATFEQAAVGMAHVAPDGSFLLVNDRFCEIAGHNREELRAGGFQQITHPDDLDADLGHLEDLVAGRTRSYAMEKRYIRRDGTIVWVNLTVSLVHDVAGAPEFFVSVIEDISARKIAETAARSDALTGVLNRRGLLEELDRLLADQRGSDRSIGVILLDLNGFKAINDKYGHAEGDLCLAAVSASIERVIRRNDRLARLGGDEFVLLMPFRATDDIAIDPVLKRLREAIVDACSDMPWTVSASIGALIVGGDSSKTAGDVIAAADRLMYDAKRSIDHQETMFVI